LDDLTQQNKKLKKAVFEAENETGIAVRRFVTAEAEVKELQSKLADRERELSDAKQKSVAASELPDAAALLNQLKAKRKKSKCDLVDVEAILDMLGSLSP
jgi:chromosome segregation ATPase